MLLQGVALHSFSHDAQEFEDFQSSLRKIRDEFALTEDEDTKLLLAVSAIRNLEDLSLAATRAIRVRQNELEAAMALISDSLLKAAHASEAQSLELKESERDVAMARQSADVDAARARLAKCLEEIRLRALSRNQGLHHGMYAAPDIDIVTALPASHMAVEAIVAAWNRREDFSVAMFAVRSLDTIIMRFGLHASDEILRTLTAHLSGFFASEACERRGKDICRRENDGGLLFRWRGPYLLGLVEKSADPRILLELQRLGSMRLHHSVTTRGREVDLPVTMNWALVPLDARCVEDMIQSLDDLAKNRLRRDH